MQYFVNISGGLTSAVAADRALQRYGREYVTLCFADTSWEDGDLYRFLDDLSSRWDHPIKRVVDGRSPLDVAEEKCLIPNSRMAPCSYELKGAPLDGMRSPGSTLLMGLDWREQHRIEKVRARFALTEGLVDFPLLWKPMELRPYYTVVQSWGIKPPRLYDLGMSHNNCGGRCVRQGQAQWLNLRRSFPERFEEMRLWEEAQRAKGGARANASFLRDRRGGDTSPLTLTELAVRYPPNAELFEDTGKDDQSSCLCNDWDGPA